MIKLNKKLTNRAGASLGISLLLFLVCAVLGSVILTAGTTTLGRVYSVSDSDQRYYSVTSAAELLSKELTEKKVTITRTKESKNNGTNTTDTYTMTVQTFVPTDTIVDEEKVVVMRPLDLITIEEPPTTRGLETSTMSFLTARTVELMFGKNTFTAEEAMGFSFAESVYVPEAAVEFTVNHKDKGTGTPLENLKAYGTYLMKKDGTLIITVSSKDEDDKRDYTLTLTLTPIFDEQTSVSRSTDYSSGVPVETTVTTKTSTVEWEVGGVSKRFEG